MNGGVWTQQVYELSLQLKRTSLAKLAWNYTMLGGFTAGFIGLAMGNDRFSVFVTSLVIGYPVCYLVLLGFRRLAIRMGHL